MERYYNIAGLTVRMDTFGRALQQAQAYEIEPTDKIDIQIESNWQERKRLHPGWPDEICEYMATGGDFYKKLFHFDGIMFHASAVVVDGRAYLFSADPGTGKSTHTKLWLDYFGERAFILNDDKPALRLVDGCWMAYGTPWSGKHDISANIGVPVAGIAMLHRGEENVITPWQGAEVVQAMMRQVNRPREMAYRIKLLEIMDLLIRQIPVWKLNCNMEPEAVQVSYKAMSGQMIEKI